MRYTKTKYLTLVNLSYLHELSDNDKSFEKEMIVLYIEQFSQQINKLEIAYNTSDYDEIEMIANNLRSSVAVIMGDVLSPFFREIEIKALNKVIDQQSLDNYKIVVENLARVITELKEILLTEYY